MSKVLCIIQARMGSTRLPGKVLFPVLGKKTLLEYQIERLSRSKKIDKIVVATTSNESDQPIEDLCKSIKIDCFRGSEEDVLDRFYKCSAKYLEYKLVVRINGDCPLADPDIVDGIIGLFIEGGYDYVGNADPATFPDGFDAEVMSRKALEKAWKEALLRSEREHVTLYIRNNPIFKKTNFRSREDNSDIRLTIDEPKDYEVLKFLVENGKITYGYKDFIKLLNSNPKIKDLNSKIGRDEGLATSLRQDKIITPFPAKIIAVLGGGMKKNKDGKWQTTSFDDAGDFYGIVGDRLRVLAAEIQFKEDPFSLIITLGGKGQLNNVSEAPAVAQVIKNELIALGVPADKIVAETKSENSFEQLQKLRNIAGDNFKKGIVIISNLYHLPRLKAMLKIQTKGSVRKLDSKITFMAAEKILIKEDEKKWKGIIDKAYKSTEMKERIKSEKQGVKDLKDGIYKSKNKND